MKMLLAVLAIAAFAALAAGSLAPGLRIKFDVGLSPDDGTDYFFHVPMTNSEAYATGWAKTRRPRNPTPHLPQLNLICATGKRFCGLYDDNGHVAGLQIAFRKDEFTNNVLDWKKRGFQSWNTSLDGQCVSMLAIQQYFASEEYLAQSKEKRLTLHDSSRLLQENAVWLPGGGRKLLKVSNNKDIVSQGFTEQSCLPWMGQHYYYNMTETLTCEAENIYPWFPMTLDGQLISSGFMTFGNLPVAEPDIFERPALLVVKTIVPHGPECLYELARAPGALTMHIYYTSTPWLITC